MWQELLAEREWEDVAQTCCYSEQYDALGLKPEEPPSVSCSDDPHDRSPDGRDMLRSCSAAGLSRYEPNPLKVLSRPRKRSGRFEL